MGLAVVFFFGLAIFFIFCAVINQNEKENERICAEYYERQQRILKAEENSNVFWTKLEQLNSQYKFSSIKDSYDLFYSGQIRFEKKTNTTHLFYSDEKRKAYLVGRIYAYYDWFSIFIRKTNENIKKYYEYETKVKKLYNQYYPNPNERSNELLNIKMLKEPSFPSIHFIVRKGTYLGYGKTQYENRDFWYNLSDLYEMVLEKKGKSNFIKEERAKMSDSLRYTVLSRDKFCCVLCGKSRNDGIKLEVDHIIPVSKGGKTELSNLQTLCERCNRGKSDRVSDTSKDVVEKYTDTNKYILKKKVELDEMSLKKICVGTCVKILAQDTGEKEEYMIVNDSSKMSEGQISFKSPLGQALMYHRVGDIVTINSPDGMYKVEILNVK